MASDPLINHKTAKGRNFIALATVLGGPEMVTGINRIIDGLCPDCGQTAHNPENIFASRCYNVIPESNATPKPSDDSPNDQSGGTNND